MELTDGLSDVIQEYIKVHRYIEIPSHGASMFPYIRQDDVCRFNFVDVDDIQIGDVILCSVDRGLVGHRVVQLATHEGSLQVTCKGDTNQFADRPLDRSKVLGRLTATRRHMRWIQEDVLYRRASTWLVLNVPFVSLGYRQWIVQQQIWKHRLRHLLRYFL